MLNELKKDLPGYDLWGVSTYMGETFFHDAVAVPSFRMGRMTMLDIFGGIPKGNAEDHGERDNRWPIFGLRIRSDEDRDVSDLRDLLCDIMNKSQLRLNVDMSISGAKSLHVSSGIYTPDDLDDFNPTLEPHHMKIAKSSGFVYFRPTLMAASFTSAANTDIIVEPGKVYVEGNVLEYDMEVIEHIPVDLCRGFRVKRVLDPDEMVGTYREMRCY